MEVHPTSARLLRTTLDLLEAHDPDDVTVDMVLSASGVSKGSLYHHYRDFNDLLDRAQVLRFGRDVDDVIILSTQVIARSTTVDQFAAGLGEIVAVIRGPQAGRAREQRIWVLAQATLRPSLREALGLEQQRLTDCLAELVREAQYRGWVRADLDSEAVAVFLQALTLGKVIDDVSQHQVVAEAWSDLVARVVSSVFLAPADGASVIDLRSLSASR